MISSRLTEQINEGISTVVQNKSSTQTNSSACFHEYFHKKDSQTKSHNFWPYSESEVVCLVLFDINNRQPRVLPSEGSTSGRQGQIEGWATETAAQGTKVRGHQKLTKYSESHHM
jgi:hypothetical protein